MLKSAGRRGGLSREGVGPRGQSAARAGLVAKMVAAKDDWRRDVDAMLSGEAPAEANAREADDLLKEDEAYLEDLERAPDDAGGWSRRFIEEPDLDAWPWGSNSTTEKMRMFSRLQRQLRDTLDASLLGGPGAIASGVTCVAPKIRRTSSRTRRVSGRATRRSPRSRSTWIGSSYRGASSARTSRRSANSLWTRSRRGSPTFRPRGPARALSCSGDGGSRRIRRRRECLLHQIYTFSLSCPTSAPPQCPRILSLCGNHRVNLHAIGATSEFRTVCSIPHREDAVAVGAVASCPARTVGLPVRYSVTASASYGGQVDGEMVQRSFRGIDLWLGASPRQDHLAAGVQFSAARMPRNLVHVAAPCARRWLTGRTMHGRFVAALLARRKRR